LQRVVLGQILRIELIIHKLYKIFRAVFVKIPAGLARLVVPVWTNDFCGHIGLVATESTPPLAYSRLAVRTGVSPRALV
jgi:hypothetical protein